jgi:thiol-disulfide isomerase/thioredoxin
LSRAAPILRASIRISTPWLPIIAALFVLHASLATTVRADAEAVPPPSGAAVPLFDPATHHGNVVVLDFWASWCAPCKRSFPWLSEMQKRYAAQGLEILAVDVDRDPKAAASFLASAAPTFRILSDPEGNLASAYKLQAMPTTFVFDREGKQRASHIGFRESDREKLEAELVELLAEKASRP